jgi:hypothetical protein
MTDQAAYTAFFDAGGHPADQPFVVVSGFIANCHQWLLFNRMWESVHKRYKVPLPFHASDFYARRPPFDKWALNDPEADSFISELATAQQLYILFGVSCIVDMGDYRQVNEVLQIGQMIPAFALGARACISLVENWKKYSHVTWPIECIFEDGDFGRGKFMEIMRVERMPAPTFMDKKNFPVCRPPIIWHGNREII